MKLKSLFWSIALFLILLVGLNMAYAVVNAQFPLTISTINKTISLWNKTGSSLFPAYLDLNVGIGTTNPINILTIAGDVSAFGSLNATNINATRITGTGIYINTKPVQASGDFNIGNISNYTQYARSSDFNLNNISNDTLRITDNASIALWNRNGNNIFLREITGNVGIGTTSPGQTLEVNGVTRLRRGDTQTWLELYNIQSASIRGTIGNAADGTIQINSNDVAMTFGTSSTERMRITTTGSVGIGTASPISRLHVLGNSTLVGNITIGTVEKDNAVNITMASPNGTIYNCGPNNQGNWTCRDRG